MTQNRKSHGFSIIELLVVMVIMLVLAGFSIYMLNGKEMYNTDDQAYTVMDVLKEARQRAITQREIMRVEINRDVGQIRLINENTPSTAGDDVEIRRVTFPPMEGIVFDRAPLNISSPPSEATPVVPLVFQASIHPTSMPDFVGTLRFQPNGTVLNAGSTATGANATITGATIYFWNPLKNANGASTNNGDVIRAITVIGSSGNTRYLNCPLSGATCPAWK